MDYNYFIHTSNECVVKSIKEYYYIHQNKNCGGHD